MVSARISHEISLEELATRLIDDGVAEYLKDSQTANEIAEWGNKELGVPRLATRLVLKWLVPVVVASSQKVANSALASVSKRAQNILLRVPYYDKIAVWLAQLGERLDTAVRDKRLLDEIIAGRRPAQLQTFGTEISADLRLGVKLLERIDSVDEGLASYFRDLAERTDSQPPLELLLFDISPSSRLNFRAQRIPFLGFRDTLRKLQSFVDSEELFEWWLIVGPGGAGKSRLALELCLRNGTGWRVGFLPRDVRFSAWRTWQPDQPTLVIADYASGRPKELQEIVYALKSRTEPLEWPVRLLLVERQIENSWWSTFAGTGSVGLAVSSSSHGEPLRAGAMTEEELWELANCVWADLRSGADLQTGLTTKERYLKALDRVDTLRRPLFATMVAEALLRDPSAAHKSADDVLKELLRREQENFWAAANVRNVDRNLLAVATLTEGIEVSALAEFGDGRLFPSTDIHATERFEPIRYEAMTGQPALEHLASLQPDIVGEFFVLSHLEPQFAGDNALLDLVISTAWRIRPAGVWSFLSKAMEDFAHHATLQRLVQSSTTGVQSKSQPEMLYSSALLLFEMVKLTEKDDVKTGESKFSLIESAYDSAEDPTILSFSLASGAVVLITWYAKKDEPEAAQRIYERLMERISTKGLSSIALDRVCHAVTSMIAVFVAHRDFEAAGENYNRLLDIAEAFASSAEANRWLASSSERLLRGFATTDRVTEAVSLFEQMIDRVASRPDEPHGRAALVDNIAPLMAEVFRSGRGSADKTFQSYIGVIQKVADNTDAIEHLASGVASVVHMSLDTRTAEDAARYFKMAWIALGPSVANRYVRRTLAEVSINLVGKLGEEGHMQDAMEIRSDLLAANASEKDESILVALAANTSNLALVELRAGRTDKADELREQVAQISDRAGRPAFLEGVFAELVGRTFWETLRTEEASRITVVRDAAKRRCSIANDAQEWALWFFRAIQVEFLAETYDAAALIALQEFADFSIGVLDNGAAFGPLGAAARRLIGLALESQDYQTAVIAYEIFPACAQLKPWSPEFLKNWALSGASIVMAAGQDDAKIIQQSFDWIVETSSVAVFSKELEEAVTEREPSESEEGAGQNFSHDILEKIRWLYHEVDKIMKKNGNPAEDGSA